MFTKKVLALVMLAVFSFGILAAAQAADTKATSKPTSSSAPTSAKAVIIHGR